MNKIAFQKAFDSIPFSDDFQERTADLLRQSQAETRPVKHKRVWQAALTVALIAVMGLSALAVSSGIDPAEIAANYDRKVAALFDQQEDVAIEESQPLGEYIITLHSIATGKVNSIVNAAGLPADRTYIVFAVRRKDGASVNITDFMSNYAFALLVDGDDPVQKTWELSFSGYGTGMDDGTFCYLYATDNLEVFADHTVKFAVWGNGGTHFIPDYDIFTMDEDGTLSFRDDFTLPHVLFTLPLGERAD